MSHEQVVTKMALTVKYVPGACTYSLLVLVDLLELQVPNLPPILAAPQTRLISPGASETSGVSIQIEAKSSAHP
jgi:hypothetical protein